MGSIPGWETKIPHATRRGWSKKRKKGKKETEAAVLLGKFLLLVMQICKAPPS